MTGLYLWGCDGARTPPSTQPEAAPEAAPDASHDHVAHAPGNAHSHRHGGGQHRFEDAEQWAKVFDDPERDAWQKPQSVLGFVALQPDDTVADLGAGTGYFAMRLAEQVPKGTVLATDVEPDMVRYLTERAREQRVGNLVALRASAEDPGLDRSVDVAFMCDVYHHIEDPVTFFQRVRERLDSDGRVVIVDFDPAAPEDAPGPPRAMRVSPDQVAARLREAGLVESRRDTSTLPYQYILELTPAKDADAPAP